MVPPFTLESNVILVGLKDTPLDLEQAQLAWVNTFPDLIDWRDRGILGGQPNEQLTRTVNILLNGNLRSIQFWLVPVYIDGVYFTQQLVTDSAGIQLLTEFRRLHSPT